MPDQIDRRTFLSRGAKGAAAAAVVGGGAGGLLAACGSSGTKTSGGTATTAAAGNPKPGGSLTFATEAEVDGFDPTKNRWDVTGLMYAHTVYDTLASIDSSGKAVPYLAQSITPNSDYTQWTIALRPNVVFHDGTPLDAAAVTKCLQAIASAALTGPALANIANISASGASTVVVACKEAWVAFPYYLTGQTGVVVSPKTLADPNGSRNPIGTGPFVFKEWVPNDHFTATKNPHYWRSGRPYLDQVTYRPIADHQARENSLKSGTVDMLHSDDSQTIVDFRNDHSFSFIDDVNNQAGEHEMHFYMVNTAKPPLDDLRVRQALAYATDTAKIIETLENGITPKTNGPFTKGSPYYADTGYPSFDLNKAKQLVSEYSKEKGPISFELGTVNDPKDLEVTQLVQGMWQAAGIQTKIVQVEQSQYILNALLGKYDVYEWRQFAAPDPDENYVWWSVPTAAPIGSLALNFARNKDPEVQAALEKGRTSSDSAARTEAYQTIGKRFGADCPYIWVNQTVWGVAAKSTVQNFGNLALADGSKGLPMTAGFVSLTDAWLNR